MDAGWRAVDVWWVQIGSLEGRVTRAVLHPLSWGWILHSTGGTLTKVVHWGGWRFVRRDATIIKKQNKSKRCLGECCRMWKSNLKGYPTLCGSTLAVTMVGSSYPCVFQKWLTFANEFICLHTPPASLGAVLLRRSHSEATSVSEATLENHCYNTVWNK